MSETDSPAIFRFRYQSPLSESYVPTHMREFVPRQWYGAETSARAEVGQG